MTAADGSKMRFFGPKWDAPLTDHAKVVKTPTDMFCMGCNELFVEGDQGMVYPNGFGQHKECGLRSVMGGIGHLVDHAYYCHGEFGPDAGLTYRESAILAWAWFVEGLRPTRDNLEWVRLNRDRFPKLKAGEELWDG